MNVSSVKNLNGEVFSAVQDASLTNVVQTNSGNWQDITAYQNASATYLTAVDLSPYQTVEGMTAYQPAGSYATTSELEQVSADITATIPSAAGLASESYVQTNSAVLTGMIDGKQDTLTFGYDEQDRINSINSSALAGGGEIPTGTMNVSGLEYNAVNEISAYNGSAIAQYGAEKQWLVHDDTIVHVANSAQYAFGCNISALQRLMGIDETVLFDSVSTHGVTGDVTLSESRDNFDHVRIIYRQNDGHNECKEVYNIDQNDNLTLNSFTLFQNFPINKISKYTISGNQITLVDGGEYTVQGWSTNKCINILQVIGIGRKN